MPPRTAEAPPRAFVEQPPADYGPSAVDPNRVQHQQMFEDRAMALQAFQGMPPEELAARQARLKSFGRAAPVAAGVMREGHANMPVEQLAQEAAKIEYYQHRGPLVSEALLDTLLDNINREAVVANRLATMRGGRPLTAAEARATDEETWERVMSNFEQARADELERLPDTQLLSFPAMEEPPEPDPAAPLQLSPPPSSPPIPPDRHSSTADFKRYHGRLYPGDVPRPADWPKPRTRGGRSSTADFRRGPENMDLFNLNAPDASEAPTEELNVVPLPPTQEREIPYAFPNEKHIYYEASSAPKESVQEFVSGNYDVPKQLVTIVAQPGAELDMDRHPHTRDLDGRQIIVTYADDNQDFISGRMELDLQDIYRNGLAEGQNWRSIGNLGVLRIGEQRLRADGTLTDSIIKRVEFVSGTATTKSDLGDYIKRIGQNPFAKNDARLRAAFGAINNRARRAAEEQPTEEHTTNGSPRAEADPSRFRDLKDFFREWHTGYNQVWQSIFDTIFRRTASASADANDGPAVDWEAPQEPVPMREEPNPYEVLNVDKSASDSEIKKVFRRMANTNHPDIGGNEEEFKKISAAYDVLGRPAQRAYYDEHGTMEGYDDSAQ